MLYPDLIDVPIDVYGGYTPAIPPSALPPGASPLCPDVVFPEGSVRTRGGLATQFTLAGTPNVNGLKTYLTPTLAQRLMVWDSIGNLYKENPQGTLNLVATRPYANLFYQSTTLFGREYQAFFNSLGGFDIPRQFDDTFFDRVSHVGPGASPAAVDSGTAGNIVAGKHQVSVAFINRQGWISAPSVAPTTWTAGGGKQVTLTAVATGPSNIVARLILFTGVITAPAVTGSFFSLPTGTQQLATPTVMLINDNTTTAITLDFTDVILIAGFAANFLFTQLELGESAFAAGYNSRTVFLGERNKQGNFVNLSFDGGFGTGTPVSSSSGPLTPGVVAAVGFGTPWNNPNNIVTAAAATAALTNTGGGPVRSNFLQSSSYGFAIPANATIVGIKVVASVKSSSANTISDNFVQLLVSGSGSASRANGNLWGVGFANQTYGSSADLWGMGALLTPASVNAATFGVGYAATNNNAAGTVTASVNGLSIQVFYTTPSALALPPLGWTPVGGNFAGGDSALNIGLTADYGDAFSITGDGATNVRGQIQQAANADWLSVPIIARNTAYNVRFRSAKANGLVQGTLHVLLTSASLGISTGFAVQASQLSATYVEFSGPLTTAIINLPSDLLLQVFADGTPTNGGTFLIDSIEVYPLNAPFNYSTARLSHAFNPESFDATTGAIQIRPNDGQQLRAGFPLRNNYYLAKDHYLCYVTDDGVNEPASWPVNEVSSTVGICGPNAVDWTEEWAVSAERSGLYLHWGGDPVKVTPEIQEDASLTGKIVWNSINWQFGHTVWVRIDKINKRILVGAPVNGATQPNVVFVLDYKWLDTAQDIASSPMVTYSAFTGKILAHGRGRRWTYWNISANSMTYAERADGTAQPFFGNNAGNGKIYEQLDAQLSDDGAAIFGFYDTYFAPSAMDEQMMKLGAHRKLLGYLKWRAIGVGSLLLSVTQANRTTNLRNYTLSLFPTGDGGRGIQIHGERFSFRIGTFAVGAWFQLEKLIPCMKKDPTIVVRGVDR